MVKQRKNKMVVLCLWLVMLHMLSVTCMTWCDVKTLLMVDVKGNCTLIEDRGPAPWRQVQPPQGIKSVSVPEPLITAASCAAEHGRAFPPSLNTGKMNFSVYDCSISTVYPTLYNLTFIKLSAAIKLMMIYQRFKFS